jgi:hypothetical protein
VDRPPGHLGSSGATWAGTFGLRSPMFEIPTQFLCTPLLVVNHFEFAMKQLIPKLTRNSE